MCNQTGFLSVADFNEYSRVKRRADDLAYLISYGEAQIAACETAGATVDVTSFRQEIDGMRSQHQALAAQLQQLRSRAEATLGALDDPVATAIGRMRHLEGIPWEEIAKAMHRSEAAARRRLAGSIHRLQREQLQKLRLKANSDSEKAAAKEDPKSDSLSADS